MVQEWVAVMVLALPLGLVLGYLAAMPRVLRLERESAQQLQLKSLVQQLEMYRVLVKKLESELAREKQKVREQHLVLGWDLQ
jgi:uncharacterized membrane-anchored protein YhcB (DUF1043 family)